MASNIIVVFPVPYDAGLVGMDNVGACKDSDLWTEDQPIMAVFLPVHDSINDFLLSPAQMLCPELVVGVGIWLDGCHRGGVCGEFQGGVVTWRKRAFDLGRRERDMKEWRQYIGTHQPCRGRVFCTMQSRLRRSRRLCWRSEWWGHSERADGTRLTHGKTGDCRQCCIGQAV